MITQWFDPEGGSAALPGVIARALSSHGAKVDVLTGYPNYPSGSLAPGYRVRPYQLENVRGIPVHRAPMWPNHDASGARRAVNYLSFAAGATAVGLTKFPKVDAALVHLTPATVALPGLALRKVRNTPYVVHIQDLWPETVLNSDLLSGGGSLVERMLHVMCDSIYRNASAVAVTSPGMATAVEKRGIPTRKIHFVPNWADESSFTPRPRDTALRNEWGLGDRFTVLYAGNFGEYQCIDNLLVAADLLRARSDIVFAVVGGGVDEPRLRHLVTEHQLSNVKFIPPQPFERMASVMSLGDLHYIALKDLPLFRTTIPSKVQATLAAGRPIVAAIPGDAARVISDSGAGDVVPTESPSELATAIERRADEGREGADRRGRAASQYYRTHFSEASSCAKLLDLLESAAGGAA